MGLFMNFIKYSDVLPVAWKLLFPLFYHFRAPQYYFSTMRHRVRSGCLAMFPMSADGPTEVVPVLAGSASVELN